ncbi:metallophosphoesterase family protein [Bordetella muralis]|uniref:metallophosphoesterase family protein n=1 Tax=Bordetella muralis TaxID=1649130 RepID=UPI0039F0A6AE
MTRILHLSDTHFGTEREPVVQALLRLANEWQPDLVLLSGDITQRARGAQFAAARRFVQALQRPVLAVPGNHDIPLFNVLARWLNPYGGYRRAMGAVLEPAVEMPGLLAIGVNSTRPSRHKNGQVDRRQVERVVQRLRKSSPDCLRIVVLHHPVRAAVESDQSNLLIGREWAVPAWIEAGVDLILGGHIHLPYVLPASELSTAVPPGLEAGTASANAFGIVDVPTMSDAAEAVGVLRGSDRADVSEVSGADASSAAHVSGTVGASRRAWVVQAGTAVSQRVRGGISNSINLIEHEAGQGQHQCVIQRWDYAADLQAFARANSQTLDWSRGAR